jgi:putative Mg2+ transporter-C (MgtC) family protein
MEWGEIALRLGAATAAGMLIGIDRELRHRAAGLKTHMLVSIGAASVMLVALQLDPNATRVVQGVVTGIGFIGAGAIMRQGTLTYGTATAASIWNVGIIGGAVGYGYFDIGIILAAANIVVLRYLARFKRKPQQERDRS